MIKYLSSQNVWLSVIPNFKIGYGNEEKTMYISALSQPLYPSQYSFISISVSLSRFVSFLVT